MCSYYDLTIPSRALLMTLLFVCSNASIALLLRISESKRLLHARLLLPLVTVANAYFCVIYATETRVTKFSRELSESIGVILDLPIIVCISLLLLCTVYIIFVFLDDLRFKRCNLSRASVKESLEKLPTGLCFYREGGRIVLLNNVMNSLCYKIVGRDLQNAALFWEILKSGELTRVERLSSGENPSFRLSDGRVFSFSRTVIDGVIQLVAADTTDISNVNAELEAKNRELSSVNERLREYGERVDELTRTRERITIKAYIHRELGQALLITRRFLVDTSGEQKAPIGVWKKNIAMLSREADYEGEDSPLEMFLEAADAAGVRVVLDGEFPSDTELCRLLVSAAVECLVNGVRHAEAKTLYITIQEKGGEASVVFENDGRLPDGDIVEGGGLSSIRYGVMRHGGEMKVISSPKYSLYITLPTEGMKQNVEI